MNKKKLNAFTLIELSIVMIIIGLVISGAIVGAELVNQSRLKNVIDEFAKYTTAIREFKDQYGYYPGDIPNASSVISSSAVNGDGNYKVAYSSESFNAWKHLILSNYVNFNWTSSTSQPPSAYGKTSGYVIATIGPVFNIPPNTVNALALTGCAAKNVSYCAQINSSDGYYIDSKIDDSNPSSGKLMVSVLSTGCISSPSNPTIESTNYTSNDAYYNLKSDGLCNRLVLYID